LITGILFSFLGISTEVKKVFVKLRPAGSAQDPCEVLPSTTFKLLGAVRSVCPSAFFDVGLFVCISAFDV
jgi:hypothetical protein